MPTTNRCVLTGAALLASSLFAAAAYGQMKTNMSVTSVEIAQLPTFCWAQLDVPDATGDEYRIRDCGPAANHYCSGLLELVRAKGGRRSAAERLDLVKLADVNVAYTERGIKDYPKCSIRQHVADTRAEVNSLLALYGGGRSKAK